VDLLREMACNNSGGLPEEIIVASKWWLKQLNQSIPLHNFTLFERYFLERCVEKFEGHWFPENPQKGQAYRSITYDLSVKPDPLLLAAAHDAQLDIHTMFPNFLENAVMWIDPGEVVVRTSWSYSHRGTEETLYPPELPKLTIPVTSLPPQKLTAQKQPSRPYSPPKAVNGRKNEHQNSKQSSTQATSLERHGGARRPSEPKTNLAAGSSNVNGDRLNVYSSVFVPSNYSDYWAQHERVMG